MVLAAAHESTRLLFVVGQPLGQEAHLTVRMSAAQADPAEILCQDQVPLLIQQLCVEVGTTVEHVEPFSPHFFPLHLSGMTADG